MRHARLLELSSARLTAANGKTDDNLNVKLRCRGEVSMTYMREPVLQPVPIESLRPTPDHGRHAGGRGKTQTLAKAEAAEDRRVHRPPHDTGRAGAEKAPLRHRPPSSFAGAAQGGIAGRS